MNLVKFMLAVLVLLWLSVGAYAQGTGRVPIKLIDYDRIFTPLCFEEFILVDFRPPVIPVGCEVIDCCPGCPGPGPIDWRINLEGELAEALEIRFESLPESGLKGLSVKGAAEIVDANTLRVRTGESLISGFAPDARRVPVGLPDIKAAAARWGEKMRRQASSADEIGTGHLELRIAQFRGSVVVNEFVLVIPVRPCRRPEVPKVPDRVDLNRNDGNDRAVVLLDGRRTAGCVDDEIWRGNDQIAVGNVLSNGACDAETIVFSDDDSMRLVDNVTVWTDALGNRQPIDQFPNLLQAPVTVWVMEGTFANTQTRATNDLARANQLYNTMNCGIAFQTAAIRDQTANANTPGLLNAACGQAANLRANIGFTANNLNVYYLNNPGARGWWCGNNTVIVGMGADNESLAHEFGHAFTLGHTNNVDLDGDGTNDFGVTNLMQTGGTTRDTITEGQCFRCNVNDNSFLNNSGVRTGITRDCPDGTVSTQCVSMALDVVPN